MKLTPATRHVRERRRRFASRRAAATLPARASVRSASTAFRAVVAGFRRRTAVTTTNGSPSRNRTIASVGSQSGRAMRSVIASIAS